MTRILVINSKDLWSGGVVSILSRELDFEIFNKNIIGDVALVSVLEELRPDAVIINESFLITYPSTILRWHKLFPQLRVIVLDEHENLLHIYDKHEVILEQPLDLITSVRRN